MMPALLVLALGLDEAAAGPLTVDWNKAQPVRYHVEMLINTPRGFRYLATKNMDGRALQTGVATDLSCTGAPLGKGWKVICKVDTFAIEARGDGDDQPRLDVVMAEYTALMKDARVEMELKADGTIRVLDLEGVDKGIDRQTDIAEQLRQIMRRTMAPMSVSMPKDGEGAKPWKHAGMPMFYELHTMVGTTGGVAHGYKVDGKVGDTVFIVGQGKGNVSSQLSTQVGAYQMSGATQARFDPTLGLLAYSEVATTGNPGNSLGQVSTGQLYGLSGWMGRLNDDGTIEALEGPRPLK
jgi:hypothetical protein